MKQSKLIISAAPAASSLDGIGTNAVAELMDDDGLERSEGAEEPAEELRKGEVTLVRHGLRLDKDLTEVVSEL